MTAAGRVVRADSLPGKPGTIVDRHRVGVTAAELAPLAAMTDLGSSTLYNTKTTQAGVAALWRTLPKARVIGNWPDRSLPVTRTILSLIALVVGTLVATAHDLWLVPPAAVKPGEKVTVEAVSGTKFPTGDHAPDPAKFAERFAVGPDGKQVEVDAAGMRDKAGLLTWTPPKAGVYGVAVQTAPKVITLDAEAFNSYLVSDGLPHVYRLRAKEKSLDQDGVERYSKSPKALVRVGDGKGGDPTKPLGLPLEIVPLSDPFAKKPGDALKVRVLFGDKPLADANLGWDHPGEGEDAAGTVRTDAKGEALVPVAKAGLMTVRLTHMTRPKAKEYEWESFWTTLTFHVPGDR